MPSSPRGWGKQKGQGKANKSGKSEQTGGGAAEEAKVSPEAAISREADPQVTPVVKKVEAETEAVNTGEAGVMNEVASLIRTFRLNAEGGGPGLGAIRVQQLTMDRNGLTLLDGGATHCLRLKLGLSRSGMQRRRFGCNLPSVRSPRGKILSRQRCFFGADAVSGPSWQDG